MSSRVVRRIVEYGSIATMARQCKREGIPLTECAIRRLVKEGAIPASYIGNKAILYWGNILAFVKNGTGNKSQLTLQNGTIRKQ